MKRWQSIIVLVCASLTLCGCGGSNPVPPPPVQEMPASIPPPMSSAPSRKTAKRVGPRRKSESEDAKEKAESVRTSNDYRVSSDAPGMRVLPPGEYPEQNLYALSQPVVNSSFVSVKPQIEEQTERRSDEIKLTIPSGFVLAENAVINERGFPDRIHCEADGTEMVLIEGGVFTQGTNTGPADAKPEHLAFVSPFYMDTTEITLSQFQEFQNRTPEHQRSQDAVNKDASPDHPALGIAWMDANRYAKANGKALPTEAEWERAARGPRGNPYPWGKGRPPVSEHLFEEILPVGSRPTDLTKSGLYDMAGNAREWTTDWYSAIAYADFASSNQKFVRNPHGPRHSDKSAERVVKGSRDRWDLWTRSKANLRKSGEDIGFRCILRITEEMINPDGSPSTNPQSSFR